MGDNANELTSLEGADLFSLAGKVAIVTGGARGLGKMMAAGLLRAGAKVCITSRKEEDVMMAAAELSSLGDCRALPGDAGSPEGIADLAARLRKQGERMVHVLVNNAGRTWERPSKTSPTKRGLE